MEISFEELQQNYSRKTDEELINIATCRAGGLRPEVLEIIEKELQKRNLSPDILKGAQAQQRQLTMEELETYSSYIRNLPCPVCGDQTKKLNGTIAYTVKSFIVITNYKATPVIACADCLDQSNTDAMVSTAVLGWWGFPWGLLKTPSYIYKNMQIKKQNRVEHPNDVMLSFTLSNIGLIETYKENKAELMKVIQAENN